MSTLNKTGSRQLIGGDESKVSSVPIEDADDVYRNNMEFERVLLRSKAVRALRYVEGLLDQEIKEKGKKQEIESAICDLERIVESMADEPLACSTAEALKSDDWIEYDELRYQYGVSGNMPMLLAAFTLLVDREITPGRWILEPLADAFYKILEDSDPELVATRLGLQARGSGSKSPIEEYNQILYRARVNKDMKTLIEEFGVSKSKAANAVIEKFDLKVAPKTLVNTYESRSRFPVLVREALDKYSDELKQLPVWFTENAAQEFLNSFPQKAQKYLNGVRPRKT